MTNDEVYSLVLKAIVRVTRKAEDALHPKAKLVSDLNMESIDAVDLLFELEKSLNISINLADIFQKERNTSGQKDQFDLEIQEIVNYILKLEL